MPYLPRICVKRYIRWRISGSTPFALSMQRYHEVRPCHLPRSMESCVSSFFIRSRVRPVRCSLSLSQVQIRRSCNFANPSLHCQSLPLPFAYLDGWSRRHPLHGHLRSAFRYKAIRFFTESQIKKLVAMEGLWSGSGRRPCSRRTRCMVLSRCRLHSGAVELQQPHVRACSLHKAHQVSRTILCLWRSRRCGSRSRRPAGCVGSTANRTARSTAEARLLVIAQVRMDVRRRWAVGKESLSTISSSIAISRRRFIPHCKRRCSSYGSFQIKISTNVRRKGRLGRQ